MRPSKNMTVGYVDAGGKKKQATVTEVHSDEVVMLDHSSKAERDKGETHIAHVNFDEQKKTPNSWHFLSDGNGSAPAKKEST